jgi:pyruvate dehydrogenase E2 component (dihydrolipoamide acetyltransferase)
MASYEFKLPDIGEGVVEGEVVKWKVSEGEIIKLDQPMVEVMTDKATVEIPAPRAGKVTRIMIPEGKICLVGQVMVVIEEQGKQPASSPSGGNGQGNGHVPHMSGQIAGNVPASMAPRMTAAAAVGARVLATPATRRAARELGVDLKSVTATGRNGRVTTLDVKNHARGAGGAPAQAQHAPISIAAGGAEERVPFRGVRKAIAANLARSKQTAAHFTYVEEVDVTELVLLRARAKAKAAERGVKITYLPFIVKAALHGLRKWPSLNASLDEVKQEIVLKKYYHMGIATQGPQGLSVGVLRDADKKSIVDLARETERIAEAIRQGKAAREELTGSTFTISSLGQLGGVLATPIINFPEAAIMGVHKIAEKPAVFEGKIVARHLMNLSISVDHRIADGYDGAMFLQEVKAYLEDPTLLFMEMV